jgi:hypothetical protein
LADQLIVLHKNRLPPNRDRIEALADTAYATEEELPLLLPGADILLAWWPLSPAVAAS